MTVREWLRANNYNDIADTIDEILAEFKADGSKERRNWADVLCGNDGQPVTIAGREFPILKSAQISRGLPVSATPFSGTGTKSSLVCERPDAGQNAGSSHE